MTARRNYDRTDATFYIDTTFFCAGNNYLVMEGDLAEHRIEFDSIVQFKSKDFIESEIMKNDEKKKDLENKSPILPESYFQKLKIADPTIKDKIKTDEFKNAFVFLLLEHFVDKPISVMNNNVEEDDEIVKNVVLNSFLEEYEITGDLDNDIIPVSDFDKSYFKKLKNELDNLGIIIKKNSRRGPTRNKVCIFGVKIIEKECL
jgi:hypothetical protein